MLNDSTVKPMLMRTGVGGLLCLILSFTFPLHADSGSSQFELNVYANQKAACDQRLTSVTRFALASSSLANSIARINILKSYSSFSIGNLPGGEGFIFSPSDPIVPPQIPVLHPAESKSIWRIDHWKTQEARVNFVDLGFKNLEYDMDEINWVVSNQMENAPRTPFELDISVKRAEERQRLKIMRWRLHDVVLNRYEQMKEYLTEGDMAMLDWANAQSDNSDLFAIVNGEPLTADQMTLQTLVDKVALTIQIMYFGKKDFERPTLEGALAVNGMRQIKKDDALPFEARIIPIIRENYVKRVYSRFDPATTCEFMRYAKVDKTLPRDIHDRFLLEVLLTAKKRGMKTVLASGDSLTSRLFRRYGFEIFDRLPTKQVGEPEYLSYLDLDSEAFAKVVTDLHKSSKDVEWVQ